MSWYYNYYLTEMHEDGKLYPLTPYDSDGMLLPVLTKSRSFASDLWENFARIEPEIISDELYSKLIYPDGLKECQKETRPLTQEEKEELKKYSFPTYEKELKTMPQACYDYLNHPTVMRLELLPKGDFVKEGYILASQLEDEERDYYPILPPHAYAERLKSQLTLPSVKEDEEDIRNFVYHKWIDFCSPEYEASQIRSAYNQFSGYAEKGIYVLLCQG